MSERLPCRNGSCEHTILQTTWDKTGGYCMPCFNQMKREERMEYIRKNKRDVDLYKDLKGACEILKVMHAPKPYDPLKNYIDYEKSMEDMYECMSEEEIKRMRSYVLELIEEENFEQAQEILLAIVCFTDYSVDECLRALIRKGEFIPSIAFKNAPEDVREALIGIIQREEKQTELNNILLALAWIGDDAVVRLFSSWKKSKTQWADRLYVAPDKYSLEAGWEIGENGERRDLFYKDCYALKKGISDASDWAEFLGESNEKCGWCGHDLINLISVDLKNPLSGFLNMKGERLNIATCYLCSCYGDVYTNISKSGESSWSSFNPVPEYLPSMEGEEIEDYRNILCVSKERRGCYHAASQFLETTFSQIGGHPTWIQDAHYPKCPKCSAHMKFVGQVDFGDVEEYGEGMYYSFVCEECSITAASYQQS